MVKCNDDCIPCCDFCIHCDHIANDNNDEYCMLHSRDTAPEDTCEDFYCINAQKSVKEKQLKIRGKINRDAFKRMVKRSPTREMKDNSYYLSDRELREALRLDSTEQK